MGLNEDLIAVLKERVKSAEDKTRELREEIADKDLVITGLLEEVHELDRFRREKQSYDQVFADADNLREEVRRLQGKIEGYEVRLGIRRKLDEQRD